MYTNKLICLFCIGVFCYKYNLFISAFFSDYKITKNNTTVQIFFCFLTKKGIFCKVDFAFYRNMNDFHENIW